MEGHGADTFFLVLSALPAARGRRCIAIGVRGLRQGRGHIESGALRSSWQKDDFAVGIFQLTIQQDAQ